MLALILISPKLPDFIKLLKYPRDIWSSISISSSLCYNYHHRDSYKACGPEYHLGQLSSHQFPRNCHKDRGKIYQIDYFFKQFTPVDLISWIIKKQKRKSLKYLIHNILRKILKCHLIVKEKTQWNWWTQKFDMKLILFFT